MLKKCISFSLCLIMLFSVSISAFAASESSDRKSALMIIHEETIRATSGEYANDIAIKTLFDLDGNEFELVETGSNGYYIFDRVSGKYLEKAADAPSPYLGLEDDLYYFGPMNYYQLKDNLYEHTRLSRDYDCSTATAQLLQSEFASALGISRAVTNDLLIGLISQRSVRSQDIQAYFTQTRATNTYITNSNYIRYAVYPANVNGTCGYTAACLILNYWHKSVGGVINSAFLDSSGNLKTTGHTLQDQLLSYGNSNGSWGKTIRDALIGYCNDYGVSATSTYYVTNWDIFAEVGRNRPVIVFGSFPSDPLSSSSRGSISHAVTAYGKSTEWWGSMLIVHYGWSGYEHIILDSGLVGSSTQFILN